MNGNGSSEQLLAHYIAAADGDADELLGRILTEVVDPVTARVVFRKLGTRIVGDPNADGSPIHEVGLGVAANVRLSMIAALRRARQYPAKNAIESMEAYATTVARNAANECLRRRFPARFRLSNQIRYLLRYDPTLQTEKRTDGIWVGAASPLGAARGDVAGQLARTFVDEWKRLVVEVFQLCLSVVGRLLFNSRQLVTHVRRLRFDHTNGFLIDKQNVVGRAYVSLIFAYRDSVICSRSILLFA